LQTQHGLHHDRLEACSASNKRARNRHGSWTDDKIASKPRTGGFPHIPQRQNKVRTFLWWLRTRSSTIAAPKGDADE
jgi:hypothetical protein